MEINETIDASRSLLRQGETGKALETIIGFLEKNPRYSEVVRTLQVLEANYNATRQQEIKGILSFQEAQRQISRVNDGLLSALEDLSAGRVVQRPPAAAPATNKLIWIAGGAVVLIAGLIAGIWLSRKGPQKAEKPKQDEIACPGFSRPGQKVIVLPFQNIGETAAKPELIIQSRIRELSGKNSFPSEVQVLTTYDSEKNNPDNTAAAGIGKRCGADLVVWGLYDKSKDSIKVDIHYVFTRNGILGGTAGFLAFKDLPSLRDGRMVRGLDDAILALCGLMAIQSKNGPLALKWFEKVQSPQPMDKNMVERLKTLQETVGEKRVLNGRKN